MNSHAAQVADRERASELLARYPNVSDEEAGEIRHFLRARRHLRIGLGSSSDRLRPKLNSLLEDHKAQLRVTWRESAALAAGLLVLLITAWLIWGAFAEAAYALAEAG